MKKSRRLKPTKKLIISVDKVRDLQPEKLDNVAGGNADAPEPCTITHPRPTTAE